MFYLFPGPKICFCVTFFFCFIHCSAIPRTLSPTSDLYSFENKRLWYYFRNASWCIQRENNFYPYSWSWNSQYVSQTTIETNTVGFIMNHNDVCFAISLPFYLELKLCGIKMFLTKGGIWLDLFHSTNVVLCFKFHLTAVQFQWNLILQDYSSIILSCLFAHKAER